MVPRLITELTLFSLASSASKAFNNFNKSASVVVSSKDTDSSPFEIILILNPAARADLVICSAFELRRKMVSNIS